MSKYHYVYRSFEEWGREYIGVRSCECLPEEDTKYFGSFMDKSFSPTEKTILFVCETRKEAAEIEIKLHDFFDVAVNPKFANRSKQTSTKFDATGVPRTEETKKKMSVAKSGEKNPMYGVPHTGVPHTEETKKKLSKAMSGENNPRFGVLWTEEWKKAQSERMSGRYLGALSTCSKAIIAIKPDGTELHFGSGCEAVRELGIPESSLRYSLKNGKQPKKGKCEGCQFFYEVKE